WPSVTKIRELFGDGRGKKSIKVEIPKISGKDFTDSDLRPTPPTPPPRSSSVALPLKSHSCAYREQLQEQRQRAKQPQPSDSLHSLHSSSKPQTGSSVEPASYHKRFSFGEEEDESGGHTGRDTLAFVYSSEGIGTQNSKNKNDAWVRLLHRSSGSEEDSPAGLAHQVRRPRGSVVQESYRRLCKDSEGQVGTSNVPFVSRVSKVNIPSFLSTPLGSRCSSRYSSTETLKAEDPVSSTSSRASSSVLSKTYHGNATMYRSPSFGHGDNFSRAPVRVRPRLVPSLNQGDATSTAAENRFGRRFVGHEKDKDRISMSNPDIATETLSLLSYVKTDLSELRMKRRDHDGGESSNSNIQGVKSTLNMYRMGLRPTGLNSRRPSLKDLTATLRRTKSFTYSEKPFGSAMRSSSEQRLDCESDGDRIIVSDRDVESDDCSGCYDYEEPMPTSLQDLYVQEARQVIRDICQMSANKDDDDDDDAIVGGISEENMFGDKSLDELSGHESSLTDEGIVTEPEAVSYRGLSSGTDLLGQTLTVWTQSGLYEEHSPIMTPEKSLSTPASSARTEYETVAIGGDVNISRNLNQSSLEAPATPSALRRRRKFSSAGNNGSESSNGSNGESNGESAYRSLSDPMPHRNRSLAEDSSNSFSMDSNLLSSLSLNSKVCVSADSSADLSECTGSAASDLSVYSDSLRDYSTEIQSIMQEPGAMDKLIDEKANGKAVKKKSFSDPSRRGELTSPALEAQKYSNEPINELEQLIPPSSSEPILSEQRDELWELNSEQRQLYSLRRSQSQSEQLLPFQLDRNGVNKVGDEEPTLPFDPKLAQVLSPCISRRGYKKRTHRVTHQQSSDDGDQLEEQSYEDHLDPSKSTLPKLPVDKIRPKHVRHASEPATFVPIATPNQQQRSLKSPEPQQFSKHRQREGTPSLEDVTEQYILALNPVEGSSDAPADGAVVEGTTSVPATSTLDPQLQRKSSDELTQAPLKTKPRVDMRRHVMMTLLDTEQSYVDSLRTLIQSYMKPLKQPDNSLLCDPSLVDEMFYQIPEILEHHELFLEQVITCVNDWHDRQTIGDLLVQSKSEICFFFFFFFFASFLKSASPLVMMSSVIALIIHHRYGIRAKSGWGRFSKEVLANIYSAYIDNFLNAKDAVRIAKEAKPAFMKFLEVCFFNYLNFLFKWHIFKINSSDKYSLNICGNAIVDILKMVTSEEQIIIFFFALYCLQNIMSLNISLHLPQNNTNSLLEQILTFTFIIIAVLRLALSGVRSAKSANCRRRSAFLIRSVVVCDDVIKDLMASVHRELAEKQSLAFSMTFLPTKLELSTASADSTFIFEFSSPDARSNFEQAFEEAKKKLGNHRVLSKPESIFIQTDNTGNITMNKDEWDPEFLKAIPIMKTRSGMQFSCASPSHSSPENVCEVWVCNSDGYVGQVCVLSIRAEPTVEACIAVCSARIICIAAVPGLKSRNHHKISRLTVCVKAYFNTFFVCFSLRERVELRHSVPTAPSESESSPAPSVQPQLHISISRSSPELSDAPAPTAPELGPFESDDSDDEDSPSPSSTLQSQASHSTISSSYNDEGAVCKDMAPETTSSEEEQEFSSGFRTQRLSVDSPMDGRAMRRSSRGSFTRASLEDLLSIDPEAHHSSVWLGTEDGCIHVYQSSDNIRNRKNSMKMQHSASILCILYLDNKVFVSLANGEVIVYQREAGSFWDPQSSQTLCLGSPSGPVTKMVPVGGKLWCGCQNRILIMNTSTLTQEHSFVVGQDSGRCVTCMVSYGQGVWVALQGSAQVRLYHSTSYESITEVDVAPAVHKMLAGSDAIIRQHKAACLRITALLACRDVLWIGTSAGVVLTLPVPPVTSNVGTGTSKAPLVPTGSAHGHTGHVRFLTSIELPEGFDVHFPSQAESEMSSDAGVQQRRSSTLLTGKSTLLVISGGDGYEDFRLNSSSETVGRDDSTNHLLLWHV
ncbi:rho guanine nucleotide exchange factor 17-like, partial [Silurus asotus]